MKNEKLQFVEIEQPQTLAAHPKRFVLWVFIGSIFMMFAALTSAYIVRKADGNWLIFDLPDLFLWSTAVILASSATMHWSLLSAKKDEIGNVKVGLGITLLLGSLFLFLQWEGWREMVGDGVFLAGPTANPAGSFVYVISGLHGLHILGGLAFLAIMILLTFRQEVHSKSLLYLSNCTVYWHFVDILWIYLYVFMFFNR